jgi:hypothetical protein
MYIRREKAFGNEVCVSSVAQFSPSCPEQEGQILIRCFLNIIKRFCIECRVYMASKYMRDDHVRSTGHDLFYANVTAQTLSD